MDTVYIQDKTFLLIHMYTCLYINTTVFMLAMRGKTIQSL